MESFTEPGVRPLSMSQQRNMEFLLNDVAELLARPPARQAVSALAYRGAATWQPLCPASLYGLGIDRGHIPLAVFRIRQDGSTLDRVAPFIEGDLPRNTGKVLDGA